MAKSFTQLVGTTTAGAYPGSFTDLSQNNSTVNVALGKVLVNNQHRYYLERFFDNEATVTVQTIGPQTLAVIAPPSSGDSSATLTATWDFISCHQLVTFSGGEQRTVFFTQGSDAILWTSPLTEAATSAISAIGVQAYLLPANVSKVKNTTITIGQLVYTPAPVQSVQEWTLMNALPYTSDIPAYFYIYQNQINFWPIPSSTGNIITLNCKSRVMDMTFDDYATGTVAGQSNSNVVTGTGTAWNTGFAGATAQNIPYFNLKIRVTPLKGDGLWYPIQKINNDTDLILGQPVVNFMERIVFATAAYVIGQFPLLQEDFEDVLIFSSLKIYYSSIVKDKANYELYSDLTKQREDLMKDYLGSKSINVDLGQQPIPYNPNLFTFAR